MNIVNSKKLLHSKWTAVSPEDRRKHFVVTEVINDEAGFPQRCVLEAVYDQRVVEMPWRELKDSGAWRIGWR